MSNTESIEFKLANLERLHTLPELLTQHLTLRPDAIAYKYWSHTAQAWLDLTFRDVYNTVHEWRHAFSYYDFLGHGERVAMHLPNCPEAIYFDQAALANCLVPVPLHAIDTPKSSAFILNDSEARVLVTNKLLKWKQIRDAETLPHLKLVVVTDDEDATDDLEAPIPVLTLKTFLEQGKNSALPAISPTPDDLAAIVYTSGTTGNPKGVMLSHDNIITNIRGGLGNFQPNAHETMLSFLPLSHTFERTACYYLSLAMGFTVGFNRSIAHLQEDFKIIRPTVLMSVPRIYEIIYGQLTDGLKKKSKTVQRLFHWAVQVGWRRFCKENDLPVERTFWQILDPFVHRFLDKKVGQKLRAVFGDRINFYFSSGAALHPQIAKTFLALGVNVFQGYGMSETSPIISINKQGHNHPMTVGPAIPNIQVKLSDVGELLVKGPNVMKGYWKRPDATAAMYTEDGWLKTGDICKIYPDGNIRITGRIKEIIVTSTGEKVPPADLELAIQHDPLFSQVMVIGDDQPYIVALAVVNPSILEELAKQLGLNPSQEGLLSHPDLKRVAIRRIKAATQTFPNYGVPRQVALVSDPWTIDNGLLTPTLKMRRAQIYKRYKKEIEALYELTTHRTNRSKE